MEHYLRNKSARSSSGSLPLQTKPFSYQASKCVLEHLEPNTRFLLVSHCPLLHNRHIITPLKINALTLDENSIQINDYTHRFVLEFREQFVQGQRVADTFLRYSVLIQNRNHLLFDNSNYFSPSEAAQRYMQNFILKGLTPFVKKLNISWCPENHTEPKFRVKQVQIYSISSEKLQSIIDPMSFPVEKLTVEIGSPRDFFFQEDWSKLTKFLRIELCFARETVLWTQTLSNLRNETVQVYMRNNIIRIDQLAELARNWINNSRKAGTKYTFQIGFSSTKYLQELARNITTLTGMTATNDDDQLWFSFEIDNEKELMIYREYGPCEEPTCIDRIVHWTLAMEIL